MREKWEKNDFARETHIFHVLETIDLFMAIKVSVFYLVAPLMWVYLNDKIYSMEITNGNDGHFRDTLFFHQPSPVARIGRYDIFGVSQSILQWHNMLIGYIEFEFFAISLRSLDDV